MSAVAPMLHAMAPSWVTGEILDVLDEIRGPRVNVCVLERALPWSSLTEPEALALVPASEVEVLLDGKAPDARGLVSFLPESVRDPIGRDVERLARVYGTIVGRRRIKTRLEIVVNDACRKFHADYVGVRLLCTYFGPGTDWAPEEFVRRENLGRIDVDMEEANASVIAPEHVRSARPGDVILLKGEAWPGNAHRGAVHRSPPIAHTGKRRLVLKMDAH